MKRICYVCDAFPVISETFVLNEILEVQRRGIEVRVISMLTPREPAMHEGAAELATKTIYVDQLPRTKAAFLLALAMFSPGINLRRSYRLARSLGEPYRWFWRKSLVLSSLIHRTRCKRIHVHFAGPALKFAILAARSISVPISFTCHRYDIFDLPPENFRGLILSSDACVTVSDFNRQFLCQRYQLDHGDIEVIPCGADDRRFSPNPKTSPRRGTRILTTARLWPPKDLGCAIRAAATLKEMGVDFEWRIIGEGPERAKLEAQIAELTLQDRVRLLGAKTSDEVRAELQEADVFVLSSKSEGAPVAYFEAMAMELPIVGTDVAGVSEFVVDGANGYLVPSGDHVALAARIALLASDEELRHRIGSAGREKFMADFTLRRQVDKLLRAWTRAPTSPITDASGR